MPRQRDSGFQFQSTGSGSRAAINITPHAAGHCKQRDSVRFLRPPAARLARGNSGLQVGLHSLLDLEKALREGGSQVGFCHEQVGTRLEVQWRLGLDKRQLCLHSRRGGAHFSAGSLRHKAAACHDRHATNDQQTSKHSATDRLGRLDGNIAFVQRQHCLCANSQTVATAAALGVSNIVTCRRRLVSERPIVSLGRNDRVSR